MLRKEREIHASLVEARAKRRWTPGPEGRPDHGRIVSQDFAPFAFTAFALLRLSD